MGCPLHLLARNVSTHRSFIGLARSGRSYTNSTQRSSKSSRITPGSVLLASIPIITFGLGIWQVQRLRWKLKLIDDVAWRVSREPLTLPNSINPDVLSEFEFRKVIIQGVLDNANSILVGPKTYEGVHGFHLITPLRRLEGSTILVNRGFVSADKTSEVLASFRETKLSSIGLLRQKPKKHWSAPDNNPESRQWHWIDVDQIAKSTTSSDVNQIVQPVLIDEIFSGDVAEANMRLGRAEPIGRDASVQLRNTHFEYAFIWFSLSALTAAMSTVAVRQRLRTRFRMPTR